MCYSATTTLLVLAAFFLVALLPRVPLAARVIALLVGGVILYFGFGSALFALPNGDRLPVSDLYGGRGEASDPLFNKMALGLLAPLLGIGLTLASQPLRKLLGPKTAS